MRRFLIASAALALIATTAVSVFAWGPAGHKIVASIAFSRLSDAQQEKIVELLKHHPRFQQDFTGRMPENVDENEWIFQQAAIWPDLAKGLPDPEKKQYSRPQWHYIDLPYFPTDEDRSELEGKLHLNTSFEVPDDEDENMNVVQAMKFAQRVLRDPNASEADKAKFLSWIFHLVGDAHQPLHAATLCTSGLFPGGDHGGNWIPTVQGKELHALWDGFPGSPRMKFSALRNKAKSLAANRSLGESGAEAAKDLNVETWVKESHEAAENDAYTQEVLEHLENYTDRKQIAALNLSEDYLKNGGDLSKRRLVEAGFRLGEILKAIAGN